MYHIRPPRDVGWYPLFYLLYAGFVFIQPAVDREGWHQWSVASASVLIFLLLYFTAFFVRGRTGRWCLAGMAALGFAYSPFNGGATCYIIYAGAFFGFYFEPRVAISLLGALIAGVSLESWILRFNPWTWGSCVVITAIVGLGNVYAAKAKRADAKLRLAHDEIEHLAKVAERERIARDLHDVLGHTLSVIVLKSELASKLIEQDVARARTEILETEQIARDALAEVRLAIGGYRASSLAEEISRARSTLKTAGIDVESETQESPAGSSKLSPGQETVLALALREAVTNVVRHSGARNCRIVLERDAEECRVRIEDDGRGGVSREGNGLKGMRERIEALDGTMALESSRGTRLSIAIPIRSRDEAIA